MKLKNAMCLVLSALFVTATISDSFGQSSDGSAEANGIIWAAVGIGVVIGLAIVIPFSIVSNKKKETTAELTTVFQQAEDAYIAKDYSGALSKYMEYVNVYDNKHANRISSQLLDRQYNYSKDKIDKLKSQ